MSDLTRHDLEYDLPESAIAQAAIEPRDAARLLDTRDMTDHTFRELPGLLEPGDLLVLNRTRVRSARIITERADTGGRVEVLVLGPRGDDTWNALVRPARRLRSGQRLAVAGVDAAELVTDPVEGRVRVRFLADDPEAWFATVGTVPLPPYLHTELADPERYQTVFGDTIGSAAAPTASLHMTERVLDALTARRIATTRVTLDVGLGTFRPVSTDLVADHVMHAERFSVSHEAVAAVAACRERGGRVVALGTTVARTLETVAAGDGLITAGDGETDLFITPGYRFGVVDVLVTNFHVPGSTLVAMVAAAHLTWRETYAEAQRRGYRFLSLGDAMLVTTGR